MITAASLSDEWRQSISSILFVQDRLLRAAVGAIG